MIEDYDIRKSKAPFEFSYYPHKQNILSKQAWITDFILSPTDKKPTKLVPCGFLGSTHLIRVLFFHFKIKKLVRARNKQQHQPSFLSFLLNSCSLFPLYKNFQPNSNGSNSLVGLNLKWETKKEFIFPSGYCKFWLQIAITEWCLSQPKVLILLAKTWFLVVVLPMWGIMQRLILMAVELVNCFAVRRKSLNIGFLLWRLLSLLWMVIFINSTF